VLLWLLSVACVLSQNVIMLQAFDWDALSNRGSLYSNVSSQLASIKSAGFNAIWLPPPSVSADTQGYLPTEWYTLVSESSLKSLVGSINSNGILSIVDTVINHRCATAQDSCTKDWTTFTNPNWGNWAVVKGDAKCDTGVFCPDGCSCGASDTGENACYAPDVDHTNSQVQSDVKAWLSWLQSNVGFKGNRFDMVVGYSASFIGEYLTSVPSQFAVGEYWDSNANNVENWIKGTGSRSNAFDFPLRYTLQTAVQNDDYNGLCCPPGVLGLDKLHSVPFTDNHDTARDDRFGTTDQIKMGYAYILTHPGTPCVFWDDWISSATKQAIIDLIGIRKELGINSGSDLSVDQHTSHLYSAYIDNKVAMKLGNASWSPPDTSYKLRTSGSNYAVWSK